MVQVEQDLSYHTGAGGNTEERGAAEARRLEQEGSFVERALFVSRQPG